MQVRQLVGSCLGKGGGGRCSEQQGSPWSGWDGMYEVLCPFVTGRTVPASSRSATTVTRSSPPVPSGSGTAAASWWSCARTCSACCGAPPWCLRYPAAPPSSTPWPAWPSRATSAPCRWRCRWGAEGGGAAAGDEVGWGRSSTGGGVPRGGDGSELLMGRALRGVGTGPPDHPVPLDKIQAIELRRVHPSLLACSAPPSPLPTSPSTGSTIGPCGCTRSRTRSSWRTLHPQGTTSTTLASA